MIKKLIFILTLFMSLSLAYADLTTENQAYYNFDDLNDTYNIFGATGTDNGMSFDGYKDYLIIPYNFRYFQCSKNLSLTRSLSNNFYCIFSSPREVIGSQSAI